MVPVVGAEDGRWLVPAPLAPTMKPGGHGAIWKLMLDQGIFRWFAARGREAALIRQIRSAVWAPLRACLSRQAVRVPVSSYQRSWSMLPCHIHPRPWLAMPARLACSSPIVQLRGGSQGCMLLEARIAH